MGLHRIIHDLKLIISGEDPGTLSMSTFGSSVPQTNSFWEAIISWFNSQDLTSNLGPAKPEEDKAEHPKLDLDAEDDRTPVIFVDNSTNTYVMLLTEGGDSKTPVKIVSGHSFQSNEASSGGSIDIHSIGYDIAPIHVPQEFHSAPIIVSVNTHTFTELPIAPPPSIIIPAPSIVTPPIIPPDNCGFDPTTLKDGIDPNDGQLTLREAVIMANQNGNGLDTICLGVGTYELNSDNRFIDSQISNGLGDLKVTQDLVIHGEGKDVTFIDANWLSRILEVCPGVTLTLRDLTLTHGDADNGGAILNFGHLLLDNVGIVDNQAGFSGGAIASMDDNESGVSLSIVNTVIDNNSAFLGGGIYATGYNSVVDIFSSTLSHNYSDVGGAAFIDGLTQFNFVNSTASGNAAFYGSGGAFLFTGISNGLIENSTITDNHVYPFYYNDYGYYGEGGGAVQGDQGASIVLASSIVAGNDFNLDLSGYTEGQIFFSNGHNLIGSTDGSDFSNTQQISDITGSYYEPIDPLLGPLADNGGPTFTHAVLSGSLAIGNGSNAEGLVTDQRGEAREYTDGYSDIGAYQTQGDAPIFQLTPIVLDMNDDGININNSPFPDVIYDAKGDGSQDIMKSWISKNDAFLVFDQNGDDVANGVREISFTSYLPGAKTDLEGLQAFDTNGDRFLDQKDANYSQFGVWQDANQNGKSDPGEYLTLQDVGIVSISLQGNGTPIQGENFTLFSEGTFEKADGSKHVLGDVGLAYSPIAPAIEPIKEAVSDGGEVHKLSV